ncbi:PadR family transcriptional regulator PadR [Caldicoprobacter guelmensis]|uniref:PadR family transcriptional regulator n=1 Tax=Caldicoprobacter guelmensis TaxID=1170224 RepID=UPI00195CF3E4|nr:PadR family transcriptional regulator [Caldicoprobacter guelmensis]MBM7582166.1 PadR family transcriptional regulator PadR [Caldicoprobacter guelmensis]
MTFTNTQLKKGVLELCILYQLKDKELYGYQIMKAVKDQFSDVYDGSIYAILRRLNAEGYTQTYIKDSPSGPARKYYRITPAGVDYLNRTIAEWQMLVEGVRRLGIPF